MSTSQSPHEDLPARRPGIWLAAVVALVCTACPTAGRAIDTAPSSSTFEAIGREVQQIHKTNKDGLARIRVPTTIGTLSGTGFFVDADGLLISSSSLIANKDEIWVDWGGLKAKAAIVGMDRRSSTVLLKSNLKGMPLKLSAEKPKVGDAAIALGYQYDKEPAPAFGLISGIDATSPEGRYFCAAHIRADISLAPGMMGGPLLNTKGEVIGLVTGTLGGGTRCYALPSLALARVMEDLRQHGRPRLGWVGISIRHDTNANASTSSVIVKEVFTNAPAITAGVRIGDRVVRIADRDVRHPGDIIDASFLARIGDMMPLVLRRGDETLSVELPVQERPLPPHGPAGSGLADAQTFPPATEGSIQIDATR